MKNLIYLLSLLLALNVSAQSTLGRTFKVKGKSVSNESYKNKQKEAQLLRNQRLKARAAKQLEDMRKRQQDQAARRAHELATRKCAVNCSDQQLHFRCDMPAPKCLNGEAADITDPYGNVIGKVEASQQTTTSTDSESNTEMCTLNCSNGESHSYACNARVKPKCGSNVCVQSCPGGQKIKYYCNDTPPQCEGSAATTPSAPTPSTPGAQCVGEDFRCGYFTVNTCSTGGNKICPAQCEVKCSHGTYKQLCRLRPISCDILGNQNGGTGGVKPTPTKPSIPTPKPVPRPTTKPLQPYGSSGTTNPFRPLPKPMPKPIVRPVTKPSPYGSSGTKPLPIPGKLPPSVISKLKGHIQNMKANAVGLPAFLHDHDLAYNPEKRAKLVMLLKSNPTLLNHPEIKGDAHLKSMIKKAIMLHASDQRKAGVKREMIKRDVIRREIKRRNIRPRSFGGGGGGSMEEMDGPANEELRRINEY